MKRKLIISILLFLPFVLSAQVTINVQLPAGGFVQKEQLWNIILVNNNENLQEISIRLSVQDASTGQIYLSANSGNIFIGKGVKIINVKDVQPVSYNYNSPDFSRSFLPMGSYVLCYQVYQNLPGHEFPLGEECTRINIDPLSPPLLNSPADNSELSTPYPQFTWMPPSPFDMFSNLSYDIIITEVLPGQSSVEAIQYNNPVYTRANILQTSESYPSSFSKLDTGKVYAWQIVATNGASYAAKTEVWTFKLKKENKQQEPVNSHYILLDNKVSGTYVVENNILHVKYFSYAAEYETQIVFTNVKGEVIKRIKQKIIPGDNYLDLNISHGFKSKTIYRLFINDPENKMHILSFSINKK